MNAIEFSPEMMEQILTDKVMQMASGQLKVLTYAFKEMNLDTYNELLKIHEGEESIRFREEIERDLTYVGTFGLEDPLRDKIIDNVNLIRFGCTIVNEFEREEKSNQVNVRMISGDHIETCKSVAV